MNRLCIVIVGCEMTASLGMRRLVERGGVLYGASVDDWQIPADIGVIEHHPLPFSISAFLADKEAKEMVRRRHYLAKNQGRKPFMMRRKLGG